MTTAPNIIIDEKDALRVVAQMTIGEIVRGIAALSMSAPVAESPEVKGEEWPRVIAPNASNSVYVFLSPGAKGIWFHEKTHRGLSGVSVDDFEMPVCTELTGPAKLAKLKELGCDERGVYVGKGETREWPKLVGQRNWEPSFACWVFQSSNKGNWWVDGQVGECIYSLDSLLEDKRMVVLDTPEARAFIANRYDEQGNLRAEYRKGETGKVRVFTSGPAAKVWRSEIDGDYLINDRFNANATGSVGTCVQNGWDELPPAEVPQWLSDHGYLSDGTRKQETPATPIDPDAGKKYGEAVARLVKLIQSPRDVGFISIAQWFNQIEDAAAEVEKLDAAQGGVR